MRYCINCGKSIGDNRFCTKCGADNGANLSEPVKNFSLNSNEMFGEKRSITITIYTIQVLLFAISTIIMLVCCVSNAGENTINIYLNSNSLICVVIYFFIGMWTVIPTTAQILALMNNLKRNITTLPFIMVIMFALMGLTNSISGKYLGKTNVFESMFAPYLKVWLLIVLLSVSMIVLEFIGRYRNLGVSNDAL